MLLRISQSFHRLIARSVIAISTNQLSVSHKLCYIYIYTNSVTFIQAWFAWCLKTAMTFQERTIYQTPLPPFASIPLYTILECILGLCFTVITILLQLPYEYIDENPVPTIIFKGRPTTFQAFVVCIIFAFSGATNAIVASNKPRFARFCGYYAMASMASALVILWWAVYCACVN